MHLFIGSLVWFSVAALLSAGALIVGYHAYRARFVRERVEATAPVVVPTVDPMDEYGRLGREIRSSLERAQETAESMRVAVERGVR